ncbi:MAG TPA: hypothetical protein VF400_00475, partial [Anaeromyxobacteraceae bacterium]
EPAAPPAPVVLASASLPGGPGMGGVLGGAPTTSVPDASALRPGRGPHKFGLQLDGGVPDGAAASLLYRPLKFVRLGGGLLYNYAGYGVRGGVTILPYFPIAPSLTLEVGHYFDSNVASGIGRFTTVSDNVRPLLQRVGYTFVNAQVGLELGHPDWFVFFVRGGLSRVWLSVHGAEAAAQQLASGSLTVSHMDDPSLRLAIPDVKVGFILYFY